MPVWLFVCVRCLGFQAALRRLYLIRIIFSQFKVGPLISGAAFTSVVTAQKPIPKEQVMYGRQVALFLLSLLILATLTADTRAQAVYGSISGTVTDAQGAVIPDATVTITSIERNTTDTVQTNDSGLYVKDRLLP